jgi:eukaryotic-like serine/threonine-protein kinase
MSAEEPTKSEVAPALGGPDSSPEKRPTVRPGGATSLIGMVLSGRYKIEKLLGEGGMGAVYQAEHTHMRKRLAVKVLHPEMSRLTEVVQRFEREAMAAAHIDHPNVATATDFGKLDDGSFFLVMEFLEGKSLRDLINVGRLEMGRALHILRQIAAGLTRAHALGIVHRDLKPENVMLVEREGESDFVKVLDFGIAKVPVGELAQKADMPKTNEKGPVLTQMGMVYGTPEYMAPEQALGQEVDPRADVYAMGVMGFEMLTGSRPYDHESKVALLGMHVTAPIPLPSERCPEAQIPPEVDAHIKKLLAKEASERYQDGREAMDATLAVLASLAAQGLVDQKYAGAGAQQPQSQMGLRSPSLHNAPPLAVVAGGAIITARGVPGDEAGNSSQISQAPPARMHVSPRAILAGVAGIVVLVAIFVVVLTSAGSRAETGADSGVAQVGSTPTGSGSVPKPPPIRPDLEPRILAAIALVDKGDYGTAIAQLTELEKANDTRTDIHRALVDAYMATKRPVDAMEEVARVLELDPGFSRDKALRLHIRNAALTGGKEAEDKAFDLLDSQLGSDGPDVLYDIAYLVKDYPKGQARARALLKKPEIKGRSSDELKLAMEVRAASEKSPCEIRKMLDRAAEFGDFRTGSILKGYQVSSGCGFLGRRDCWPCLHNDGALGKAIKAIDDRAKEKSP